MKHLRLYDAMSNMSITITETGYEMTTSAGTAQYDAWGGRLTVNGIPEYFPRMLSVKQLKQETEKVVMTLAVEVKPVIDESALAEIAELVKKASSGVINGQA